MSERRPAALSNPISPELVLIDPELVCAPNELETVMIDSPNGRHDHAQPSLETLLRQAVSAVEAVEAVEALEPDVQPHITLVAEPEQVVEPTPVLSDDEPTVVVASTPEIFDVVVRLTNGETVRAGGEDSREAAEDLARATAGRFADGSEWPLVAGRCLRPDLVVSVDVICRLEDS